MRAKGTHVDRPQDYCGLRHRSFRLLLTAVLALLIVGSWQGPAQARVLEENDLVRVARIKFSFTEVMTELSQSSQRTDLSSGDSECIKSALRGLMQISQELKPYEYLITIEDEMKDFGDDLTLRGVVRFAVDNALKILESERRRMGDLFDQCSRYPLSAGKTRQAIQFIDGTSAILRSLKPRL